MNNEYLEYIGKQFGNWLILSFVEKRGNKPIVYCKCLKCNKTEREQNLNELRRKNGSTMCNSCANRRRSAKDLSGKKFGKLTVIKRIENKGDKVIWLCSCDCGEKVIKRTNELNKINDDKCHHNINQTRGKNKYIVHDEYVSIFTYDNIEYIIDLDDYYKLNKYTWHKTNKGYLVTVKNKQNLLIHRLIMKAEKGEIVDHINGDICDNRKINLRICNKAENAMNSEININNTSGYNGVYYSRGKWVAYITKDYKKIRLGSFNDIEKAVDARLRAEIDLFGEFSPSLSRK